MGILVRAVITGFGFSVGQAIFKRVEKKLGLDDRSQSSSGPAAVDADADGSVDNGEAEQPA